MQFISVRSLIPAILLQGLTLLSLIKLKNQPVKGNCGPPTAFTLRAPETHITSSEAICVFVDTPWHGMRCF